jgi:hypothetical protein
MLVYQRVKLAEFLATRRDEYFSQTYLQPLVGHVAKNGKDQMFGSTSMKIIKTTATIKHVHIKRFLCI